MTFRLKERTTDPDTPVTGEVKLYAKTGSVFIRDENGTVTGLVAGTEFEDDVFRILDNADATKELAFEVAGISTATTRTITVPDANVDLGDLVVGPASATDNALSRYDNTTGKLVQDSGVLLDDSDNMSGIHTAAFDAEGNFGNSGSTPSINFTTLGQKARITLTAAATFSFTFPGVGNYILKIIQDGTGSWGVTLPATARAAGSSIDLAGTAGTTTLWSIYWDGTNEFISSMPDTGSSAPTVNLT